MKHEQTRRIATSAAVLGLALAALALYSAPDFLASFLLFGMVFVGLGIALLAVLSAEKAIVRLMRWTERYFGWFRTRDLGLAAHSGDATRFQRS